MNCSPNIILIGLMGCGKTTVGRVVAKKIDRAFVDSDIEMVRSTGVEVSTIFEIEGESAFRDREHNLLQELVLRPSIVLATGGGAVVRPNNRPLLRDNGIVVYMHASPETVWHRTKGHRGRPLLATGDPFAKLRQLYAERDAWYRETAHHVIEVGADTPSAVAAQIESLLSARSTAAPV